MADSASNKTVFPRSYAPLLTKKEGFLSEAFCLNRSSLCSGHVIKLRLATGVGQNLFKVVTEVINLNRFVT